MDYANSVLQKMYKLASNSPSYSKHRHGRGGMYMLKENKLIHSYLLEMQIEIYAYADGFHFFLSPLKLSKIARKWHYHGLETCQNLR